MAIDEPLAKHVRAALADATSVREVKMFGGIGFMLNGNMVVAVSDRGLLARVGEVGETEAFERGAESMMMRGRKMTGYVRVNGTFDARTVKSWVRLARAFVETLPTKKDAAKVAKKPATKVASKVATKAAKPRSKP